jgi:hypothetical protein
LIGHAFRVPFLLSSIAEETGMAQQPDRDDLDRDLPLGDEEARGMGDEELEESDEGDEADLEDEDEFAEDDRLTGEVGSEGGSPGDTERVKKTP